MRTVLAVITGKGVSPIEHRDRFPGQPDTVWVEDRRWISFECQVGGAVKKGNRLSLFPLPAYQERNLWDSAEKGEQWEAHYDPERDECILSVYEDVSSGSGSNMFMLLVCAVFGAVALYEIFASGRRRGSGQGTRARMVALGRSC
jgi:hypothetical protein